MNFFDYTSLDDSIVHGLTFFERILPIVLLVLTLTFIFRFHHNIKTHKNEKLIRYIIGTLMLIGEFSFITWNFIHGLSNRVYFIGTLPLQLCSYAIWGLAFVMFTQNKKVYNYVFMFAITGVLALIFPNLNHGFNTFRYYQLYFSHSLLLISVIYMYKVHDFYPTKKDLINSFYFLQILIVFSLILNVILDTDFLFIGPGNKPIDFAWDWPYHMIQYELGMFVAFLIAYLVLKKVKKIS